LKPFEQDIHSPALTEIQATDLALRVLVSEPDTTSRRLICAVLGSNPGTTVRCAEDSRLLSAIQEIVPDLVIVDIHAPSLWGAASWKSVGIKPEPTTIVTSFDPSVRSIFASNAVDCLVKPFDIERLELAVDLATAAIGQAAATSSQETLSEAERSTVSRQFLQRLAVEAGEKIVLLNAEDISWLQASGNNIRIHLGEMVYLLRQSLKNLQSLLDPNRFLRVHRNAIVNLDHVEEFHLPTQGNMFVKLKNGVCLPLRKANRPQLRKILKNHFIA
jgi:two-component system LytT family response regulator